MDPMSPNKANIPSSLLPFKFKNLKNFPPNFKPKHAPLSPYPPSHDHQYPSLDQTKQIHAHMLKTHISDKGTMATDGPNQLHFSSQFNFLITSYIKHNKPNYSLKVYAHLRTINTFIDNFTLPSVLKACGRQLAIGQGKEIHGYTLKIGLEWDIFIHNALIQMYSDCADLSSTRKVFDTMPERDVVSCSTMVKIYGRKKLFDEALDIIGEMHRSEIKPSEVAMLTMISLFASIAVLRKGRAMHAYVIRNFSSEEIGVSVNTALIDMYVKCGSVGPARQIFDRMVERNVVSWTAMIAGCIRCGNLDEGMKLFCEMLEENIIPNEITMLSLVLECGSTGSLWLGQWLHAYMIKNGFVLSLVLATALVDMYGKCGAVTSARAVFDGMDARDVTTWTAMIAGYTKAQRLNQAFDLFIQMKDTEIKPNEVTMVNLLLLCAESGAFDLGKWVHTCIDRQGIIPDVVLATALVDMYAKCGDIDKAYSIFAAIPRRDVGMWNAMIGALAMHGHGKEAIELFSQMEIAQVKPNDITFIELLHACSHAGLVADGQQLFSRMVHSFGIAPKVEHYGCMVDLLGRAGQLDEAYNIICSMPIRPNVVVWGALLAACKLHRHLRLGELAATRLLELEPHNCGYNVLISNIYAAANRWADVDDARRAMREVGLRKEPGFSSIEVNGSVSIFVMGDKSHQKTKEIHEMVAEMSRKLKEEGHIADTSSVLLNVDEEEKETVLNYHSEKLAMAYGLISTVPKTPIRIVKNLRICDDCHAATKFLSKIYSRVIIVRDRKRFHRFSEGSCSCGDYW